MPLTKISNMFEIVSEEVHCDFIRGIVEARSPAEDPLIAPEAGKILEGFGKPPCQGFVRKIPLKIPSPSEGRLGRRKSG